MASLFAIAKNEGGLGLIAAEDINEGFMMKLGWKILHEKENSWVKVVTHKYLNKKIYLRWKYPQEPWKGDHPLTRAKKA